ncbi:class I mannose-6-phosphate isomerase [Aeromicrobium sp.]|uniref:class I mannose-6-phosphate isomerase n=1 Tax=Aeromicrobium sp. TaxID=1871063 RepID=UPI004034D00E
MSPLPVALRPNLIDHFYRGGGRIAALRGIVTTSDHQPEEWIAATVSREGDARLGLSSTQDGTLLRDLVVADPQTWTGGVGAWPGDVGLLLKLLDAGQRLPVHVHPDRSFAARHLDCPYGKTEAWLVLDAEPGAAVHLGWVDDVDPRDVVRARDEQDGAWMLRHMHRIEVRRGDGILVPAGMPHAIGEGVFVAEAQEPTDFSILLEWSITTSTRDESHLGLGFDLAMQALEHAATSTERLAELSVHRDLDAAADPLTSLLPTEADPFFRLDLAVDGAQVPAGFAALVVLDGSGTLRCTGGDLPIARGQTYAVPAATGDWHVTGSARVLVARRGRR